MQELVLSLYLYSLGTPPNLAMDLAFLHPLGPLSPIFYPFLTNSHSFVSAIDNQKHILPGTPSSHPGPELMEVISTLLLALHYNLLSLTLSSVSGVCPPTLPPSPRDSAKVYNKPRFYLSHALLSTPDTQKHFLPGTLSGLIWQGLP